MAVNHTTMQAITNVAGILFLFVVTAAHSPPCHKANLHIDSAVQVLAVVKNDKIEKYLPVFTCVFTVILLEIFALIQLVSAQEPFSKTFIRNYKFRTRSPPAGRLFSKRQPLCRLSLSTVVTGGNP